MAVPSISVHDRYDFVGDVLEPLEWFGKSYNIDIYWTEKFTLGPKKLCGNGKCESKK